MKPSVLLLLGFVHRYGMHSLFELIERLNAGETLSACAERFGCDLAYLSRFVSRSLCKTYALHPDLQDAIDSLQNTLNAQAAAMRQASARVLQLRKSPGDPHSPNRA